MFWLEACVEYSDVFVVGMDDWCSGFDGSGLEAIEGFILDVEMLEEIAWVLRSRIE